MGSVGTDSIGERWGKIKVRGKRKADVTSGFSGMGGNYTSYRNCYQPN